MHGKEHRMLLFLCVGRKQIVTMKDYYVVQTCIFLCSADSFMARLILASFSLGTLVSSINKTDHLDITEILLKVGV
jgi:hypothetical protein